MIIKNQSICLYIYIYIFIYKQRPQVGEYEVVPCGTFFIVLFI